MPSRETTTLISINADLTALNNLVKAAEQSSGTAEIQEPENKAIGGAVIEAQFPGPEQTQQFIKEAERYGGALIRQRLTPEAVLSWVGNYGNVKSAGSAAYGGSITRGGLIEQLDGNTIRIVPRGNLGGLDLGPSTFGSEKAGDVAIDEIIDITPY